MCKELQEQLGLLRDNPIFYFSLSSKELFHSNFIEWLCRAYPDKIASILNRVVGLEKSTTFISCSREVHNIDLTIFLKDGQNVFEILIENKVKSLPQITQLEMYLNDSSLPNKNGVLISLSAPVFKLPDRWFYYSYEDFKADLESNFNMVDDNQYIIKQYVLLISTLITLEKSISLDENSHYDFYNTNGLFPILKELRLHDFYLKKCYEKFGVIMVHRLNQEFQNIKTQFDYANKEENSIRIGIDMTRGTGLITIAYRLKDKFDMGIQIQHNSYKMFIELTPPSVLKSVFYKLNEEKEWFNFENFENYKIWPPKKDYKKYGNFYIYKNIQLDELNKTFTLGELIAIVSADIKKIVKNKEYYLNCLLSVNEN